MNTNDTKFKALLREGRRAPPLPPGFRQNVWRRIETDPAPAQVQTWLDALAAMIVRPKFACAAAAVLLAAGIVLGSLDGSQAARQDAQARYLASVAPASAR